MDKRTIQFYSTLIISGSAIFIVLIMLAVRGAFPSVKLSIEIITALYIILFSFVTYKAAKCEIKEQKAKAKAEREAVRAQRAAEMKKYYAKKK